MTVTEFHDANPAAVCWVVCFRPTGKYLSDTRAYDADIHGAKAFATPGEADEVREAITHLNRNDFTIESCQQD